MGTVHFTDILMYVVREFLLLQKQFQEVRIYFRPTDLTMFIVLDYEKLSKCDRDYLFGFGYRLNKALQKVFGTDMPFVGVVITKEIKDNNVIEIVA